MYTNAHQHDAAIDPRPRTGQHWDDMAAAEHPDRFTLGFAPTRASRHCEEERRSNPEMKLAAWIASFLAMTQSGKKDTKKAEAAPKKRASAIVIITYRAMPS